MIVKHTYSEGGTWRPSVDQKEKHLSNPGEISALKLSCGSTSAVVVIYDAKSSADVIPANMKWYLDAAAAGNDNNCFSSPLIFRKGVYAVCEQGWQGNPVVCYTKVGGF